MKYNLQKEQQLKCDLQTAWEFFSSPDNLARMTPDDMGFIVLTDLENKTMHEGMEIDYKVTPLFGIPLKWKTKITQVDFQKSFTDFQIKGPYKLWNHHHEFIENQKGVLMKDDLTYEMPYGWLGRLAHSLVVRRKVQSIFDYRYMVLYQKDLQISPIFMFKFQISALKILAIAPAMAVFFALIFKIYPINLWPNS